MFHGIIGNKLFSSSGGKVYVSGFVATGAGSGYIDGWAWDADTPSFGTRWAAPLSPPTASCGSADADTGYVICRFNASPYFLGYEVSTSGFGAKLTDPATPSPATTRGCRFNNQRTTIGLGLTASPYVAAYRWDDSFGSKYADPDTAAAGRADDVCFSFAGNALAKTAFATSPLMEVYHWSGAGFGAKYADPDTVPTGGLGWSFSFTPEDDYICLGMNASPYIEAYEWDNTTGFGSKISDPGVLPPSAVRETNWSYNGDDLFMTVGSGAPYVYAYEWSSGFGTKYADPGGLSSESKTVAVDIGSDEFVFLTGAASRISWAVSWESGTGWGTVYSSSSGPAGEACYGGTVIGKMVE